MGKGWCLSLNPELWQVSRGVLTGRGEKAPLQTWGEALRGSFLELGDHGLYLKGGGGLCLGDLTGV